MLFCQILLFPIFYLIPYSSSIIAAVVKEEAAQVEEPVTTAQESGAGVQEADNKSAVNRLDELFKKTSAAPQIYWLPLTTEEVSCCYGLLLQ